jgi:PIN domain nuclease of toxin-antitoxin system
VRLLLDTHVLLWWLAKDERLQPAALAAISEPASSIHVSAATIWEAWIKVEKGRLTLPDDLAQQVEAEGFARVAITFEHAREAAGLPRHHEDLFDRLLVAQARLEALTIVTRDAAIQRYDVETLAA